MSNTTLLYTVIFSILGVAVVVAVVYLVRVRGQGSEPFDVGVSPQEDDPKGEDIWFKGPAYGLQAQPLDLTMVPTGQEQTREIIERETTQFPDDLLDPRNPHHAEWEAREQARIQAAESDDVAPPSDPEGASPT